MMYDIDNLNLKGRIQQFHLRNGEDCVMVGQLWIYGNGASRETNPLGLLQEPPEDPAQRCRLQVRYHEEKVRLAVAEFDELQEQLLFVAEEAIRWADAETPPQPPTEEQIEKLAALRKEVVKRRKDLAAAKKALEVATPQYKQKRKVGADERRQQGQSAAAAIKALKV